MIRLTLVLFGLMLFQAIAFADSKTVATCEGKYGLNGVDHQINVHIYQVDEAYEMDISDRAPKTAPSHWHVALDNRFIFSRVEYYAYEPLRIRMLFNSVTFAKKGVIFAAAMKDGQPIPITCDVEEKKSRSRR